MSVPEFTLVVGVDAKHLESLLDAWESWKEHKPSLLNSPMIIFHDKKITGPEVHGVIDHPNLTTYGWPIENVVFEGTTYSEEQTGRQKYKLLWTDAQRYKMLAGFVHIPAMFVKTPYWLKLDTKTFATEHNDWIKSSWFEEDPVIISHRWNYTKPADQMIKLDEWVDNNKSYLVGFRNTQPLNLIPKPGERKVTHKRIISWCAFFKTDFTRLCADNASGTCGKFQLPVPSQDGYMWYMAKRLGLLIRRSNMKVRGWSHRPTRDFSMDVLKDEV